MEWYRVRGRKYFLDSEKEKYVRAEGGARTASSQKRCSISAFKFQMYVPRDLEVILFKSHTLYRLIYPSFLLETFLLFDRTLYKIGCA